MSAAAALAAALDGAAEVTARAQAATRAAPVDPAVRAALAELCGAGAVAPRRDLGERVRRGLLDWDEVWQDPRSIGPEGVRLVQQAVLVVAREIGRAAP